MHTCLIDNKKNITCYKLANYFLCMQNFSLQTENVEISLTGWSCKKQIQASNHCMLVWLFVQRLSAWLIIFWSISRGWNLPLMGSMYGLENIYTSHYMQILLKLGHLDIFHDVVFCCYDDWDDSNLDHML